MATDVAMDDMDIDFEEDPEIARLNAEAEAMTARFEARQAEEMKGVEEAHEEGEVDPNAPQWAKVHVRGLDQFKPSMVKEWIEEHSSAEMFQRVQWIDDTSANLIYDTEAAAAEALNALSAEETDNPLQERLAKGFLIYPEVTLKVRQAIEADVKVPGAKDRSRFYLMNPKYDPETRYRDRKRRRDDEYPDQRKYRRREWEDERSHRRGSRDEAQYDESMYDDKPSASIEARRNGRNDESSGSEYGRRRAQMEDLFANRNVGRLRDRSASPGRDGDGRYGFREDQPRRATARARSRTPPGIKSGRDNRGARENLKTELFPDKREPSGFTNGHRGSRDLFEGRRSSFNSNIELFPDKVNSPVHRRQAAKDISPDEVADAIGKYHFNETYGRSTYSNSGRRPEYNERRDNGAGRDLFSRIQGGPKVDSNYGRLQNNDDGGFSFKGASKADEGAGFSVLGASSRERKENPLVKELFPLKVNAGKKDLFEGKIRGRGPRSRAEDMF